MAQTYEIVAAEEVLASGIPFWRVRMLRPDGQEFSHFFPQDTLEWRAAEYGIDPMDTDTLLDIVLHEPHIDPADTTPTLYTAATTDEARDHHLQRIARTKQTRIRVETPAGKRRDHGPLAPIHARPINPESIAEKRAHVNRMASELRRKAG